MLVRALTSMDALASRFGLLGPLFSAEEAIALARNRSGSRDFGTVDVTEPLQHLLTACAEEAELSLVGQYTLRWDVVRLLSNTLRLRAEESSKPRILEEPIRRPVFITGLPRSGTTFLHRLLLQDPDACAPRVWQTISPYPPRGAARAVKQVRRQLRSFDLLAPQFRDLHPLEADSPQECSEIASHVFRSLRFDTTYHVPSYRRWLDNTGYLAAYGFQRRFLQHLQARQRLCRWVLKCPDHVFALNDLRAVFPDARIIFVHRDPLQVLASVAKLTEVLRAPFTRRIDRREIGRQESARWLEGSEHMIRASMEIAFSEPICHVHFANLVADPVQTVANIYRHFDMDLGGPVIKRVARAAADPPNGYRSRPYQLEEYGLRSAIEHEKFRHYMKFFDIQTHRYPEAAVNAG